MAGKRLQYILLTASYLLNILFIVLIYSNKYEACYNSDHLFAPSFFNDILNEGNSMKGWGLPGAPGFFPDLAIYFILFLVFKNIGLTFLIFSIIQAMLILLFFNLLIREILPEIKLSVLTVSNTLFCLIYLVSLVPGQIDSMTFHLLAINYHTGALMLTLICLYLSVRYIKTNSRILLIILLIICTLGVLSDKLLIIYFTLPFIISLVVYALNKEYIKRTILLAGILLLSTISGILIYDWLMISLLSFGQVDFNYSPENTINSFKYIGNLYLIIFREGTVRTAVFILSTFSFAACCYLTVVTMIRKYFKKEKNNQKSSFIFLYTLYIPVSFIIIVLTPVILGKINAYNDIRYIEAVFYLGILNFIVLANYIFKQKKIIVFLKMIVSVLIISLLLFVSINNKSYRVAKGLKTYFDYYPDYVKFVDSLKEKYNLKNGCSDHWHSKVISMFSKNNVRAYTVYNSLYPFPVLSNGNWYYEDIKNGNEQTVFNFYIVNDKFKRSNIYEQFGDSITEVRFSDMNLIVVPDFTFNKINEKIQIK